MDKTIIVLDQKDHDSTIDISDRSSYRIRYAVRAVVSDYFGKIALLHAKVGNYYKLPGGGIEDGEEVLAALSRELLEEIGSAADVIAELGQVIEWRDWTKLKQTSYCYTAELRGEKGNPEFTAEEMAEGFEVVWASNIDEAITLVSESTENVDIHISFMTKRDKAILESAK